MSYLSSINGKEKSDDQQTEPRHAIHTPHPLEMKNMIALLPLFTHIQPYWMTTVTIALTIGYVAGWRMLVDTPCKAPPARTGISSVLPAEFSAHRRLREE